MSCVYMTVELYMYVCMYGISFRGGICCIHFSLLGVPIQKYSGFLTPYNSLSNKCHLLSEYVAIAFFPLQVQQRF